MGIEEQIGPEKFIYFSDGWNWRAVEEDGIGL